MAKEILFPRMKATYQGPLAPFETAIIQQSSPVEAWFKQQWKRTPALITTSVDLRYAGFKLAPVDTNLFPAGFNNLQSSMISLCTQALQAFILKQMPSCQRILLLPENHTRNFFYLENLVVLKNCLIAGGFKVHIGSLNSEMKETSHVQLNREILSIEPITRIQDKLYVGEDAPCLILLNHDLSSGIPEILKNISQLVCPAAALGWGERLKSKHFFYYQRVIEEFSALINIDPWCINADFASVEDVDFIQQRGLTQLSEAINTILSRIEQVYQIATIKQQPFVTVKADNGTYGMGIMMVNHGDVFLNLNRRQRTHMASRKGGEKVSRLLIQEGVPTIEKINERVAESVIYLIGEKVIGGFYRVHPHHTVADNLNSAGMYFEPMQFELPAFEAYDAIKAPAINNRFYVFGVIARLAALAAAREGAALKIV